MDSTSLKEAAVASEHLTAELFDVSVQPHSMV